MSERQVEWHAPRRETGLLLVAMMLLGFVIAYETLPPALQAYWPLFGIAAGYVGMGLLLFARGEWP